MNLANFRDAVDECKRVWVKRNKQYGDAIETGGVLAAAVELHGKAARLRQLVIKDPFHGEGNNGEVWDTLLDIANYAIIGMHMVATANWDGKEEEEEKTDG